MTGRTSTDVLIIGAGPFGLAAAAYAQHLGIEHVVLGKPMAFWKRHMPRGMVLRSACDWHLDPLDIDTIEAYLATLGKTPKDVEPIALDFYLAYCDWFVRQKGIASGRRTVIQLDRAPAAGAHFEARLDDGTAVLAQSVVLAVGMAYFAYIPPDTASLLPPGSYGHTCDVTEFEQFAGRRVLIVGGRQSAFEWAALVAEAGAASVDVVYRHATPVFTASDWTWVPPLVDRVCETPSWFRSLPEDERAAIGARLWGEGRLKLEPWLASRIARDNVHLWPGSTIAACNRSDIDFETPQNATVLAGGASMAVTLDTGQLLHADYVIFATGYRVDISRVPFLAAGNLLPDIATREGYPALDEHFQASVPGLYFTSMAAARDFGPFFGFTVSARQPARVIGDHIASAR